MPRQTKHLLKTLVFLMKHSFSVRISGALKIILFRDRISYSPIKNTLCWYRNGLYVRDHKTTARFCLKERIFFSFARTKNRPPSAVSFMPAIASTSRRLRSEFVRLLFLQAHRETDRFFAASEFSQRILPVDSSTSAARHSFNNSKVKLVWLSVRQHPYA
jgi:hypothetical protein